jgi:hypothetical protein
MSVDLLTSSDLVLEHQSGGLVAGGFKIETLIGNSVALKSLKELSVPAGLFLLQRPCMRDYAEFIKHDEVIDDALYEQLVSSAEYVQNKRSVKKNTKKNKKNMTGKNIKRTRKNLN